MAIVDLASLEKFVYVILGIDVHEHDQVLAVCQSYEDAKNYCIQFLGNTDYYDLWIEKHPIL